MDNKDQKFIIFWEKWETRKWRFILTFGGIFGFVMVFVFAFKTIVFEDNYPTVLEYIQSPLFLMHVICLGLISGLIYGLFMWRYIKRTSERIKQKYNE